MTAIEISFESRVMRMPILTAVAVIRNLRNREQLLRLHAHEQSHKNRKQVMKAINQRIQYLTEREDEGSKSEEN